MGAEMLIQSIGFKAKERFMIDEQWATAAFAKARTAIEAIDQGRMDEIQLQEEYDSVDDYKQSLLDDLKEVEQAIFATHRQAATVEGGDGIILLLSGGISWGDSPGALFDSMERLAESDVFPDARWPEPDGSQNQLTNK